MKIYEIDENMAGIVAMATEQEQEALNESIARNGQIEDAVIWRGRVVDGRCRQIACNKVGLELRVRELSWDSTEDDVVREVKALNTRRNLSITQKAFSAVKYGLKHKISVAKLAKEWGISEKLIKNAKFIVKYQPLYVEALFNGQSVRIVDNKGIETTSTAIGTICSAIKRDIERSKLVVDTSDYGGFSAEAYIKTEAGKSWYYEFIEANKVTNIIVRMELARLANLSYKVKV